MNQLCFRRNAIGLAVVASFAVPGLSGQTPDGLVDYQRQIHPVLAAKCLSCHSAERRSGGLSLATWQDSLDGGRSGATIKPGNSASSLLVRRITGESEPRMPLGGAPLATGEIAI